MSRALAKFGDAPTVQAMPHGIGIVIQHDAANLPLPDESVDLIVTSPPYFGLRDYKDGDASLAGQIGAEATHAEFLQALWACSREWHRVLKPGGSLWVNLGDKYNSAASGQQSGSLEGGDAAKRTNGRGKTSAGRVKSLLGLPWRYAIGMTDGMGDPDGNGWILRAEVIWAKPNGLPESVRDRVARKHEQWFHFTKSERYYSNVDAIREPHADATLKDKRRTGEMSTDSMPHGTAYSRSSKAGGGKTAAARGVPEGGKDTNLGNVQPNPLGKLPGSVWTIATEPLRVPDELGVQHFAAFPTEWPRRIILGWAPTRGICNTCGQGLRAVVDKKTLGRGNGYAEGRSTARPKEWLAMKTAHPDCITGYACACDTPGELTQAVVLDPFGGTGTTAAVAKALGCIGISNDLSADYCRLAQWRVNGDGYEKVAKKVASKSTPSR